MRILLLDTYYGDVIRALSVIRNPDASDIAGIYNYRSELARCLDFGFGTADFMSNALRDLGIDAIDVIANHEQLQQLWCEDHGFASSTLEQMALWQIEYYKPDAVFLQDISFFSLNALASLSEKYLLAAQCSCPMPNRQKVAMMDVLFTSFPHYVDRFKAMGIPHVQYLPLAFDPRMLKAGEGIAERDLPITFVGGVGRNLHWKYGTDVLDAVAAAFPKDFTWYGYGYESLPPDSALAKCWHGYAWGKQMYRIYARSRICINRHGEVANGYSNNLRMYEATGTGALLMTEISKNIGELFSGAVVPYGNPEDLCQKISYNLEHEEERAAIAEYGQRWTLEHHTYAQRMKTVAEVLNQCLESHRTIAK